MNKGFTRKTIRKLLPADAMFIWHGNDTKDKNEFCSRFEIITGADQIGTAITSTNESDWGFTWDDYVSTYDAIVADYEANEYQRLRAPQYPSFADQFDLLYHGGYDVWKAKIDEVKNKYPKPEGN